MRVEASIAVDGGEEGRDVGLSVERREEDVITGIMSDVGELGVEAGSEEARCRQKAAKESMMVLQAEERMKECDSRGELGDMGVVAGGGAESQDQEVRAQRIGGSSVRKSDDIGDERVLYICYFCLEFYVFALARDGGAALRSARTGRRAVDAPPHRLGPWG